MGGIMALQGKGDRPSASASDAWEKMPNAGRRAAPAADADRRFVKALAKGLDVLRAFTPGHSMLGNKQITARTGLPKATVSRLTLTLARLGYLAYDAGMDQYRIAPRVLSLGVGALHGLDIIRAARPLMDELARTCHVNVGLAAPDGLEMIYVEAIRGAGNLQHSLDVGSHIPMHSTSMGRAYLATLAPDDLEARLSRMARVARLPIDELHAAVQEASASIEKHRFCTARWQPEIIAAAVPLRVSPGETQYVLNCGGPNYLVDEARLVIDVAPRLVGIAIHLEQLFFTR